VTPRRCPRNDDGAIGLLSLGMAVLALTVILVVSAASAVHLEHMRLTTAADDLALDAADALDLDRYYSPAELGDEDEWQSVQLSEQRMREAVESRLDGDGGRLAGVMVVSVGTPDGTTAVVTVAKVVRPMFGIDELLPFIDGIPMTATSRARGS